MKRSRKKEWNNRNDQNLLLWLALLIVAATLLTGCGASKEASSVETTMASVHQREKLHIAAAADLTRAFQELTQQFEEEQGIVAELSFGSTGTYAMQIENGAHYDVFAAANVAFVERLRQQGLTIEDTQKLYAQGRIGIATMKKQGVTIESLEELIEDQRIHKVAIADPSHAPYGTAAQEALQHRGLWEDLQGKLVYGRNIQDTLVLLQTGNVDAAIIALSIHDSEQLNFTLIDDNWHNPLNQAITVVKSTKQEEKARAFVDYLLSEKGQQIMNKYGFVLPED
ncbi:molybdate ABC transporter substrate-binding protein [Heliorestis convoluta]|uniref:Molybdate ABC transporter, periplasmic molybdate-binding protein n=1 Tax=Heliorestis convoluta TaxID=356322 RepID=A0A5Q2MZA7_9FIRM|nr:molybdate ABC transporter substrate-binding protein [Heliorestis convoluta]QGG46779.1 molybdate ABC transporter, periplasmic molybdate-binding protein [Heliorestis convoluta]